MLNIGIIGCGKIAQVRHLPEYEQNPGARIAGLYDLNRERAQALADADALAAQAQRQVGFGRRFAGIYIQNVPVGDDFRPRRAQRARQACHENRQPT